MQGLDDLPLLVCLTVFLLSEKMLRVVIVLFVQASVFEYREGHVQQLSVWNLNFLHSGKCLSDIMMCVSKIQEWTLGSRSGMRKMFTYLGKYLEDKGV